MNMMIGGLISSRKEAEEIESITKSFVVGTHARMLASKVKTI